MLNQSFRHLLLFGSLCLYAGIAQAQSTHPFVAEDFEVPGVLETEEFRLRMLTIDESRVVGCVYIDPTRKRSHDAEVFLWVRSSELESGLDNRLFEAVSSWLDNDWAFTNAAFPGRTVDWSVWEEIPEEKR